MRSEWPASQMKLLSNVLLGPFRGSRASTRFPTGLGTQRSRIPELANPQCPFSLDVPCPLPRISLTLSSRAWMGTGLLWRPQPCTEPRRAGQEKGMCWNLAQLCRSPCSLHSHTHAGGVGQLPVVRVTLTKVRITEWAVVPHLGGCSGLSSLATVHRFVLPATQLLWRPKQAKGSSLSGPSLPPF